MISTQHDPPRSQAAIHHAQSSRIVPKPIPKAQFEDAREYQISQVRKRFSPRETSVENGAATSLSFSFKPSDPDFPFELEKLQCDLMIPLNYPKALPRLVVLNPDMPKGFAINIENGWTKLAEERKDATLLSKLNALDRQLEALLTERKADTVKMTIFRDTRHLEGRTTTKDLQSTTSVAGQATVAPMLRPHIPDETFTRTQIAEAKARRATEVRQLEARMGRLPFYQRSSDGVVYNLPFEPKRRNELPTGLLTARSLQLIVPLLYPLQHIKVLFNEVDSDAAEPLEELFAETMTTQKEMSLMTRINYLAQNADKLAKKADAARVAAREALAKQEADAVAAAKSTAAIDDTTSDNGIVDNDRKHIRYMPRPVDWVIVDEDEGDDSDGDYSDSDDEGGATLESAPPRVAEPTPSTTTQVAERGTSISFPSIELFGIELLEVSALSINIKCERCKTINDIANLRPGVEKTSESCRKCATPFTIQYRAELVHANSTRAGFLDLVGCTVHDMLPSTFIPTCGRCSTAPRQGLVGVRGDNISNVCRECHAKFSFKIPEVKFLAYAPGAGHLPPTSGPRRQRQEKLGLTIGEPLPDKGTCAHYKKSYRWFRFSCCSKVYSCDKCHDEVEGHLQEFANRILCGWCSREMNYHLAVEDCHYCGRSLTRKRGRGYWEGGKGTRDQRLMNRNDPRKYKRIGRTAAIAK